MKMHKVLSSLFALGLVASSGCAAITSAQGGNTGETGEAWYVKAKGFNGFIFSAKVFYCPAPASGPAQ
jgi:hypothetical protein